MWRNTRASRETQGTHDASAGFFLHHSLYLSFDFDPVIVFNHPFHNFMIIVFTSCKHQQKQYCENILNYNLKLLHGQLKFGTNLRGAVTRPLLTTCQSSLKIRRSWLVFAVLIVYAASIHAVNNGRSAREGFLFHACFCFCRGHFTQFRNDITDLKKDLEEVLPSLT